MYIQVGSYGNVRPLAELAPLLKPVPKPEGYCTTDREETRALYKPHLSGVFPGEWTKCFLAVLFPNGSIPPHCDGDSLRESSQRYHLVLQTDGASWVMHGDEWQQLEEGGIYAFDPGVVHAAVHWGSQPRIHFVVDVLK